MNLGTNPSAHGLPSLTTNTGGIPAIVRDGENGYLFPINDDAKQYGERIMKLWKNYDEYELLCRNAYHLYDAKLNWEAWGKRIHSLVKNDLNFQNSG